jgi:hypothetical protein
MAMLNNQMVHMITCSPIFVLTNPFGLLVVVTTAEDLQFGANKHYKQQ